MPSIDYTDRREMGRDLYDSHADCEGDTAASRFGGVWGPEDLLDFVILQVRKYTALREKQILTEEQQAALDCAGAEVAAAADRPLSHTRQEMRERIESLGNQRIRLTVDRATLLDLLKEAAPILELHLMPNRELVGIVGFCRRVRTALELVGRNVPELERNPA